MDARCFAAAAALAGCLLGGCAGAPAEPPVADGAVSSDPTGMPAPVAAEEVAIRVGLTLPRSLMPAEAVESSSMQLLPALFSPLLRLTGVGSLEPLVAAELPTTRDAVTWTIPVAGGWTFHDGEPVTGQSFVDAWQFTASSTDYFGGLFAMDGIQGYEEVFSGGSTSLSGIRLLDPMTIEIALVAADSMFPYRLAEVPFAPMSRRCLDEPVACETAPVGNGPFRLREPWSAGAPLLLERFEEWNGPAPAAADRVDVMPMSPAGAGVAAPATDAVDLAISGDLPADADAVVGPTGDGGTVQFTLTAVPMASITMAGFAPGDPRLRDPAVRSAISMAIDRDALTAAGGGVPAHGLAPPTVAGSQPDACGAPCRYDPATARAVLAAAGGFAGTLPIAYSPRFGDDVVFRLLASQLEVNLGITVELRPDEGVIMSGPTSEGLFEIGWSADHPVAADLVARWSGDLGAELGYASATVTERMSRAKSAPSASESAGLVQQAERAVLTDLPAIPLWFRSELWTVSSRLTGVEAVPGHGPRWELLGVAG